jgi:hypothetical protein
MDRYAQMKQASQPARQRGITLIETMGALAIASAMLAGLAMVIDNALEDMKGQQAALYQARLADAARKYLAASYAQLVTDTGLAAGGTVPVTIDTLKTSGLLPASFAATNGYGQSTCVLVRRNASAAPPVKLDALVTAYGGSRILDKDIPAVALNAGAGGGYISTDAPTTAQGASWQANTAAYRGVSCNGGPVVLTGSASDGGHLVSALFYDGPGQLSTDFVYRDAVPGHPELNQMNTPLQLAQHALVTKGAACGGTAAIAIDAASRAVLSCGSNGVWKDAVASQWKEPVATYLALPTAGSQAGDVRIVADVNRAFTYTGSSWVALAVDQNGDLVVPRHLTIQAGNINVENGNLNLAKGDVNAWAGALNGATMMAWDWSWTSAITVTDRFNPGEQCNIFKGYDANGAPVYSKALGTLVLDHHSMPIPLVCTYVAGTNSYEYRYMDGGVTR